jgi:transcriptional regulator with XRE-family HTH domain
LITAIREVRRAKGLTLEEVAQRCEPPTTAQTIGRLETGTRTVSVVWLNRIAAALGVDAADLVRLPDRPDIPVAANLDSGGAQALRRPATVVPPVAEADLVAVMVTGSIGDYRSGDEIWCRRLAPPRLRSGAQSRCADPAPGGSFPVWPADRA